MPDATPSHDAPIRGRRRRGPGEEAVVRDAVALATRLGHRRVTAAHLLRVLLDDADAPLLRQRPGLRPRVDALLEAEPVVDGRVRLGSEAAEILRSARATGVGRTPDPDALLDAVACSGTAAARLLADESAAALPGLAGRLGRDLSATAAAAEHIAVAPWDAVVDRLVRTFVRHRRRCPVLVGDRDAGRHAVVHDLARRLASGDVPAALQGRRLVQLDTSALLADATSPGRVERSVRTLFVDLADAQVVAVLDDLDALVGVGAVRAVLAAALSSGSVQLLGAATSWPTADDELTDLLWPVPLAPLTPADTATVLAQTTGRYERHHGVAVTDAARDAAVRFASRYLTDRALPGKALDLVDEAAATARLAGRSVVDTDDVATVTSEWTGIPLARLLAGETAQLLRLEDRLHERVVGQHEAVAAVAAAIRRARTGVADRDRPLGSFLFLGPTGVGKTELARTLALTLFPEESSLVVFDMSEYAEPHAVARLVGAPPGYVGHAEGGQLTDRLRRRPYCVVLLDEIEKAHGDVYNVLLQVLDEGRLTDGQGRVVDARDAVLIMTSNLGSRHILDPELGQSELHERVMTEVRRAFRPEFLNRVDELVIFHRLGPAHLGAIVDIQLERLRERLADRDLSLSVTPAARRWLVEHGHDPAYGARPLRRVIRRHLADRIATALLDGTIRDGQTVVVDVAAAPQTAGGTGLTVAGGGPDAAP